MVTNERLAHYIEYADIVGDNGTPGISTGELAAMARELQSLRASIPGDVRVKGLDALVYDWEYMDPKTGHWSYARTPERANHLQAQGVKLTPVYTLEAVRQAQSALDLSPAEGEPVAWQYRNAAGGVWLTPEFERRTAYGRTGMQERPLFAAPSNPVISDEMVESVAEALCRSSGTGWEFTQAKDHWREKARSALSVKPSHEQ